MSSASASRLIERPAYRAAFWRGLSFWPRSLFGRLFVAVLAAVFLAQALTFTLVARERNKFIVEVNVREWSRRIVDLTYALQLLDPPARSVARARLEQWPPQRFFRVPPYRRWHAAGGSAAQQTNGKPLPPLPVSDFREALETQLVRLLGPAYKVAVNPTLRLSDRAITVTRRPPEGYESGGRLYDVRVTLPDGDPLTFRVAQGRRGPLFPRTLLLNLALLTLATAIVLYVVARSVTRPLSHLARAAEAMGRDVRQPPLEESGAQELREAARAFNTMQDRMHRYLDSRTSVLAAMSHDLKTPLTRMRLRVETLDTEEVRTRFGRDLDEMESMVRGTLALLKGLSDDETAADVDVDALLATLVGEFAEVGAQVEIEGRTRGAFRGRPQALKRCLTNLLSNAINFGTRARVVVEDGAALILRVQDEGPGLPPEELERVFEPFYRVESSRNRDTGGTGLGLSIARDIAQAHGGSLVLRTLPEGGLEAILSLPRVRPTPGPFARNRFSQLSTPPAAPRV
ncbi:MAG: ATP-binding protein [Steroidobacteraceae bacterium]